MGTVLKARRRGAFASRSTNSFNCAAPGGVSTEGTAACAFVDPAAASLIAPAAIPKPKVCNAARRPAMIVTVLVPCRGSFDRGSLLLTLFNVAGE
jgi:hypothetical protein